MRDQRNALLRRILFLLSFALLLILLYLSIQRRPAAAEPAAAGSPLPDIPASRLLSLPLLAADATAPESSLDHLFDQRAETLWLLARGSGPGECLEVNFLPKNMPYLSGLRVTPARADSLTEVKKMALYVNHELVAIKEGPFDFPIGQKVFSLRLCIESTHADEVYSYADEDQLVSIHMLPSNRQTGLQSILFFDQAGEAFYPIPPRYVVANVTPTSNLNPVSAFHAGQLFDGRPTSAWIEGEAGHSTRSSIQIQLAEAIQPSALAVWNGFQLSDLHFQNNSRAAGLVLKENGIELLSLDCRDQQGGQILDLPSNLQLRNFSIDIERTYPGARHPETAISELCFLEGPRPILLKTEWPQTIRRELTLLLGQTPLRFYLNRPITNRIEQRSGAYYHRNQICIRADGSFYANLEHQQLQENRRERYDISGHWVLQDAGQEQTLLRLFGKLAYTGFAAQSTPTYEEETFNEIISFRPERIEGGELLGRFYLR